MRNICFGRASAFARSGVLAFAAIALFKTPLALAQVSVSDSGQPGYSVPLAAPPGIAGMEPKLSLQYARGSQGGPFAQGWSLGGLSVITRCGATMATDGVRSGVRYAAADRLCLDGQRLILTDASGIPVARAADGSQAGYGGAGTEYRTEKDAYTRIRAYGGSPATGADSFKVWTKAGLVYEYGATASARILTTGRTPAAAMAWAVNRVSDTVGNYMVMTYNVQAASVAGSAGTEWNIAQIRYTGNGGQAPASRIDFAYETRPDQTEAYHEGGKSVTTKRLTDIRTYVGTAADGTGGRAVGMLKLGYATSPHTDRSVLAWVQNCSGTDTAKCMPKTEFTYTPGPGATFAQLTSNLASFSLRTRLSDGRYTRGVYQGDFNGDGRQDLLVWDNTPSQNALLLSNGDGTFAQATAPTFMLGHSSGCLYSIVADFNLDGISDILQISDAAALPECSAEAQSAKIYLGTASGAFLPPINVVNGQGQAMPLVKTDPTYSGGLPICSGGEANYNCVGFTPTNIYRSGRSFYVADVDGDGVPDILVTNSMPGTQNPPTACTEQTCLFLGSAQNVGTYTKISTTLASTDLFSPRNEAAGRVGVQGTYAENRIFVGDLNGDGLPDVMVRDTGKRYIATGAAGAFEARSGFAVPCMAGAEVLDINGDGKWDVACLDYGKEGNYTAYVNDGAGNMTLRGNVGSWVGAPECAGAACDPKTYRPMITYLAADLDGDGISDLLAMGKSRLAGAGVRNTFLKGRRDGSFQAFPLSLDNVELTEGTLDVLAGDFTGRGSVELLRYSHEPARFGLFVRTDSVPADILASVKAPGNAETTLVYKPLTDAAVYTRGSGAVYPVVDLGGAQWVAATINAPNGRGGVLPTTFKYGTQRADLSGRGYLGFRTLEKTSRGPDGTLLTTRTTSKQDFPFTGLPEETRRYVQSAGDQNWLSLSASTYGDLHLLGCAAGTTPRLYRPVLQTTAEETRDLNGAPMARVETTNANYTCYGDPGAVTVVTRDPQDAALVYTKATTNEYLPAATSGDTWILGRLSQARQNNTVPNTLGVTVSTPNVTPTTPTLAPPTVVAQFSPNNVTAGQTSVFSWTATLATEGIWSCTGPVTPNGTFTQSVGSVNITTNANFVGNPVLCQITVSNSSGSANASASLFTTQATTPEPPTVSFNIVPHPMNVGQTATVYWSASNATALSRQCVAGGTGFAASYPSLPLTGSGTLMPLTGWVGNPSTCTWTVTGQNGTAQVTHSLVTNGPPAPTIVVNLTNPNPMRIGYGSTFAWDTSNATSVEYTCTEPWGWGQTNSVGLRASVTLYPGSHWAGKTSKCDWTAYGPGGTATTTIYVTTEP